MTDEIRAQPLARAGSLQLGRGLNEDARRRLGEIGRADILVGIPSFNNAQTIGHVVQVAAEGMRRYFPELRAALINSDGGSTDGTPRAVMEAQVPAGLEVLSTPYRGPSGKGSAFRAVFEAAVLLNARVCVVVDSDLRSITPEWIDLLAGPVAREGYSYVAPYYVRHKYDGTITNNIAYPITTALYGKRVRQPIGGDFGFSGTLAQAYLEQEVWDTDVARFGIDIFMTTTAVAMDLPVAQANLGAKVHDPKDPASSLGSMFQHVVGTLFSLMGRYEARWREVSRAEPVPRFGPSLEMEPEPVRVDLEALIAKFRQGFREHRMVLEQVLGEETHREIGGLAGAEPGFKFPAEPWARACYDFAVAYNQGSFRREELLSALTPLYFGRTGALVQETRDMDTQAFETYIESQAQVFETLKPYLSRQWSAVRSQ